MEIKNIDYKDDIVKRNLFAFGNECCRALLDGDLDERYKIIVAAAKNYINFIVETESSKRAFRLMIIDRAFKLMEQMEFKYAVEKLERYYLTGKTTEE